MESSIKKLDDNRVSVTVKVDAKRVDSQLSKTYREFAKKYNFPGFRKGKAPRPVIDNALGREAVLGSATEELVSEVYPEVVDSEGLSPLGSANFGDGNIVEPGSDYEFTFEVSVTPQIELTSYDPVKVKLPREDATEDEIDSEVDAMRRHYEQYSDSDDSKTIGDTGYANISMEVSVDGQKLDNLSSDAHFYSEGSGLYPKNFEEELKGLKKGDEAKFSIEVGDDDDSLMFSTIAGKKADVEVKCLSVKERTLPELTDEWVKENMALDSVQALRDEIRKQIEAQKKAFVPRIKENRCASELIERVDVEVPEAMAESAESELMQDFFTQLQRQGLTMDAYLAQRGIDSAQFKEDLKMQAQDEAKQEMALDAWARHQGFKVTDDDILEELANAGLDDPRKTFNDWKRNGRLYLIREGIMRQKAIRDVMDKAIVEVDEED